MNNRSSSRTGLFLMELILAVLFFSLSGAICIQLFVNSHFVSQSSVDLNHSVLWAQNVAETFYGCNGNAEEMGTLFSNCLYEKESDNSSSLTLLFDEAFKPLTDIPASMDDLDTDSEYSYILSAHISPSGNHLLTCRIQVHTLAKEEPVYELETTLFSTKEAANE